MNKLKTLPIVVYTEQQSKKKKKEQKKKTISYGICTVFVYTKCEIPRLVYIYLSPRSCIRIEETLVYSFKLPPKRKK